MKYEIRVGFDDAIADVSASGIYFRFLDKYNALGIGHEKTRTSSIFLYLEKPPNLGKLSRELKDIPILSFRKVA